MARAGTSRRWPLLVIAAVFVRWLAVGRVPVTAGGVTFTVPALALAAVAVTAMSAAVVALAVGRGRAERARLEAWRARTAGAR